MEAERHGFRICGGFTVLSEEKAKRNETKMPIDGTSGGGCMEIPANAVKEGQEIRDM